MWAALLIWAPTSALLYALPLAWEAAFPVAWVALVPFLASVARVASGSPAGIARAAGLGMVFGSVSALGMASWLPGMLSRFFEVSPLLAWGGFAAVALGLYAPYLAAFAAALAWSVRRGRASPLLVGGLWCACELLRAEGPFVANPYGLAAYSQIAWLVAVQVADLSGPYGTGFLIGTVNALVASLLAPELRPRRPLRHLVLCATLLALAFGYGAARLGQAFGGDAAIEVALVQTGEAPLREPAPAVRERALGEYLELTQSAAREGAELVLWPESAIDFYLREQGPLSDRILAASRKLDVGLIVGGPDYAPEGSAVAYYNAAFAVREGLLRAGYAKVKLMPFSERNPLGPLVSIGNDHYTAGREVSPLATRRADLGLFICSEAMLPGHVRRYAMAGAQVLANPSNDAWFGSRSAARVQLANAQLRAIENRRWLLRPTPTGYSAVIDPHGRRVALGGFGTRETLRARIAPSDVVTPYQHFGDLLPTLAAGLAVLWCATPRRLPMRPPRRRR